ncbi:guanylate kinase [Cystobasidium minutum MCA 4210]|uniref:guanylate kinase n=1 Tax=Cystobasidium minutum MCA 4210 TaxID=1397322 RepID=UPI0034CEC105|eukprot:jgi/Rhomi1/174512/fgenesh1_kg.8_\
MAPTSSTSSETSSTRPIVISGPSGTGKSTLLKKLFDEYPDKFGFSVSHTTRAPRPGEENGKAYHFVTVDKFEDLIKENAFIEHAKFSNNMYGTSIQAVKDVASNGKQCILDIDSQGVKLIKANHPSLDPLFIFLSPPSLSELRKRLSGRGTETPEAVAARLAASTTEIEYAQTPGAYHAVVVNDDLDQAYERLKKCIVYEQWEEVGNKVPEMKED